MLVIAQGVGVALLLFTLVLVGVWHPSRTVLALMLGMQVLFFVGLCRPLGRLIQKRRLLSLDFADARIVGIKRVRQEPLLEKPPVFFVQNPCYVTPMFDVSGGNT